VLDTTEQKQLARLRRERRFRRWLTTLSWSMPLLAFGSFFSIWHNISSSVHTTAKANVQSPLKTQTLVNVAQSTLFKIGSSGPQVTTIQEELYQLGYFNHELTQYYGTITAQAVELFQTDNQMPATGEIDTSTFNALQQAVKTQSTTNLTSSDSSTTQDSSSSSVGISQQTVPQTSTSAS
jgi:peptidoglycan hydrolase-like protein with peptidoglycan-binding domain